MAIQEIVGAIIDSKLVTTDMATITQSKVNGKNVEYISRGRAKIAASFHARHRFASMVSSPALFVIVDGIPYKPQSRRDSTLN